MLDLLFYVLGAGAIIAGYHLAYIQGVRHGRQRERWDALERFDTVNEQRWRQFWAEMNDLAEAQYGVRTFGLTVDEPAPTS